MGTLTVFFDRTFGKRLPKALQTLKPPVIVRYHQGEAFAPNMPDDQWLPIAGVSHWVVLSQDRKFHLVPVELAAVKAHNVKCFYLPMASTDRWVSLCTFVRRYERIIDLSNKHPGPFIYQLKKNGQFYRVPL